MSSVNIVKEKNKKKTSFFGTWVVDVFVFAILCLFPLVFTDRYFNILQTKYYFYIIAVVSMLAALIIGGIVKHRQLEVYISEFNLRDFLKKFTVTDIALLVFLLTAVVSTVCSNYVYESFWGNEGRYSGLFLLILYGAAYFCVTRFGKMRKWYLDVFLVANMLVCLFGITDYFQMDILHFKVGMLETQKFMFTSTIGNINTYTALVGMVLAVATVLFSQEKDKRKMIFYYICMVISFFAIIMGLSDNAYLSLAALFGFLPLYAFVNKMGVKRYLVVIATFVSVMQCISMINSSMSGKVLGLESAFNMIISYHGLIYIVAVLWLVTGVSYYADYKMGTKLSIKGNTLRYIWLALLIIIISGICYILYDANIAGNVEKYGQLSNYVVFDDEWGTHRGYIWRNAMECYKDFPLFKKIFGFGPDTFGIVMLDKTRNNIYGEIYDNAHNEYIHYLITVGAVGLLAYMAFLVSFVIKNVRKGLDNPYMVAVVMAVVCYAIQAFVNLNLPIATPVMWMLLTLGAMNHKKE